jgi:hypothetical protein
MDSVFLAYKLIAMTRPEFSAEEKYLLLRTLHLYGSGLVNRPVAELEVIVGLSDGVLKRIREALVERGFLYEEDGMAREALPGLHPGGRPPKAFRVSERCLSLLQGEPISPKVKGKKKQGEQSHRTAELVQRLTMSCHQDVVAHFLFWGERGGQGNDLIALSTTKGEGKRKQVPPRYGTRLLLAILYGLADRGGVVRGVGLGSLARMAGMKRQSLEYQLGKLAEEGYLRAYVPGVTGQFAYGQAAGAFFLAPGHKTLPRPIPELLVCYEDRFVLNHHPFLVGGRVYSGAGYRLSQKDKSEKKPEDKTEDKTEDKPLRGVIDLTREWLQEKEGVQPVQRVVLDFEGHPYGLMKGGSAMALESLWKGGQLYRVFQGGQRELRRYFQFKVEEYASELLSGHWDRIDQGGFIPEAMLTRIQQDILPDQIKSRGWQGEEPPSGMPEALALFVYVLALRMAYWIKGVLVHDLSQEDWQGMVPALAQFTILPVPGRRADDSFRIAVAIVPKEVQLSFSPRAIGIFRTLVGEGPKLAPPRVSYDGEVAVRAYWPQAPGIKEGLKRKKGKEEEAPSEDASEGRQTD